MDRKLLRTRDVSRTPSVTSVDWTFFGLHDDCCSDEQYPDKTAMLHGPSVPSYPTSLIKNGFDYPRRKDSESTLRSATTTDSTLYEPSMRASPSYPTLPIPSPSINRFWRHETTAFSSTNPFLRPETPRSEAYARGSSSNPSSSSIPPPPAYAKDTPFHFDTDHLTMQQPTSVNMITGWGYGSQLAAGDPFFAPETRPRTLQDQLRLRREFEQSMRMVETSPLVSHDTTVDRSSDAFINELKRGPDHVAGWHEAKASPPRLEDEEEAERRHRRLARQAYL